MAEHQDYRDVLGSVEGLRRGFTSGTAAQAAARAAAEYLLGESPPQNVMVTLKDGRKLSLPVVHPESGEGWAACGIIKDAGDDEDITHGAEFRARVRRVPEPGIRILGGRGVGTVSRPGLPIEVGKPAINPNPRKQIASELGELLDHPDHPEAREARTDRPEADPAPAGLEVTISVPEGENLARKTWNPRLGIEGGISIIGTTGIVEPKSSSAYKASIALAVKVLAASGTDTAALAFGYVGENWYREHREWGEDRVVKTGDHIGYGLDLAAGRGFAKIVIAGHVGKMAKVAAGLFDTHWSAGDARLETVAAWAAAAGADASVTRDILDLKTAEAAVALLREKELQEAWRMMNRRLLDRCRLRFEKDGRRIPRIESILLDLEGKELAQDEI